MPTQLVVDCLDQLLPVITTIVNCSLSHGVFPEAWKDALLKPLLKKPGLDMRVWMGFSVKCYLAFFLMFSVKIYKILMFSIFKKLTVKC